MELNDIIGGQYYAAHYIGESHPTIIKALNDGSFKASLGLYPRNNEIQYRFITNNSFACSKDIRLATPQEVHWINCCVNNHNQFVEFDEAMLTFIDPSINYQQDTEYNNILIKLLS